MKAERLDALPQNGVAFDLETHLIQPGIVAPPVVCGSVADSAQGMRGSVETATGAARWFEQILAHPDVTLIGANVAYDVLCMAHRAAQRGEDLMPAILAMYDPDRTAAIGRVDGRVICVQVWEALYAIARGSLYIDPWTGKKMQGRYSLDAVVQQVLGRDNAKVNDRFRLSYALLEHIPMEQWPLEARTYPVDDAVNTYEVALAQAGHLPSCAPHVWINGSSFRPNETHCNRCGALPGSDPLCRAKERHSNSHELSRQTYVQLCGALGGAWGFHIDQRAVDALMTKYETEHAGQEQPFIDAGVIRSKGAKSGSVDEGKLKRLTAAAYGATQPCATCAATGKVPSPATYGRTKINCKDCDGTGLALGGTPRTPSGEVGIGRDVLTESGDEFLRSFAEYDEGKKIPNTYVPFFRTARPPLAGHTEGCPAQREGRKGACTCPGPYYETPLNLRFNALLETGRTSYDGVIQLMPREGGVRECIVARPGYVFSSEDYKAGELVTHAQSCIWIVGASRLAEALNQGLDAHLAGAASVLGISYEEAVARKKAGDKQIGNIRQAFKPCNFGFPGRMGAGKLVLQQRKGGPDTTGPDGTKYKGLRFCILMGAAKRCGETKVTEWKKRPYPPTCLKCLECATQLREQWLKAWPENAAYFDFVKRIDESGQPVVQHMSKRLRGFKQGQVDDKGEPINSGNAIANGYFQALLADAAKNALMAITRECFDRTHVVHSYTRHTSRWEGGPSPLLGSRVILFAHDEVVPEHPEPVAPEAAIRASELMEETLRVACPDMDPAVEARPTLMRRLYKSAEEAFDANGRLIPWEPKRKAAV